MTLSQAQAEQQFRKEGFRTVFTHTDRPGALYSPHTHAGLSAHYVLHGELTATYPNDEAPKSTTYRVGDRWDVPAGKVHAVTVGPAGATYVIGE